MSGPPRDRDHPASRDADRAQGEPDNRAGESETEAAATGGCRRRLGTLSIALIVALLLLWLGPELWTRPPRPDPTGVFPGFADAEGILPVFDHPTRDRANAPIAVFVEESEDALELHVLFPDEDHPLALLDRWYDLYRGAFRWKRVADLESFRLELGPVKSGESRPIRRVIFPGSHAGEQGYGPWLARHHRRAVDVPKAGPRPLVIEIRTWNHLFAVAGEPGPKTTMTRVRPPVFRATRAEVEAWLQPRR